MDLAVVWEITASLFTLTLLEVILGVDNLVFISIASSRLPLEKQKSARRFGLLLALGTRLILLASVIWIIGLTKPWFSLFGIAFSVRDFFMIGGGLFLLYKATTEMHKEFDEISTPPHLKKFASYFSVVTQIAIFDIIFSLDSVLTAVGMTQKFYIMAIAITIAILVMMMGSEPISRFISRHPTIRMLALSFLLLIGVVLVADGFNFHVPRGYLYFAIFFSLFVEIMNSLLIKRRDRNPHKNK